MNVEAYHLEARSPFHFGVRGVGVEATDVIAHADSLFGAICLTLRELQGQGELEKFLSAFPTVDTPSCQPPLLISSAFPYARTDEGRFVRFYPRPRFLPASLRQILTADNHKKFKKIAFVSEAIFKKWIGGVSLGKYVKNDGNFLHGNEILVSPEERDQLNKQGWGQENRVWRKGSMSRVALDRASHASQVYQAGRVHFQEGNGLWFAVRWFDESYRSLLNLTNLLMVLGDAGLGGERTAGHGQFTVNKPQVLDLAEGKESWWITLSLYHPTQPEVEHGALSGKKVSYQLLARRGWLGSLEGRSYRHRTVRMLAEGSIFQRNSKENVFGNLVDVTPSAFKNQPHSHDVYRYGLAFPVGVTDDE